ncbi:MAG: hypothetical protein KIT58_05125, partial [Planctomycetota bacterium]|nr:hypothetical protein [Planctomycetota bacterium]
IVLDLLLPRMNGWELLDWVSKRGLLSVVPVIVLSGSPECDEVPRRFPTTFECLRKPVPVDMLRAALERACREARPDRGSSLAAP